jgi:hypothetical protein
LQLKVSATARFATKLRPTQVADMLAEPGAFHAPAWLTRSVGAPMLSASFTLVVLALMVLVVLAYRRQWHWTGLTEIRRPANADEVVRPAKTVWDWLQLIVIPLALAGLAFLLTTPRATAS